MTKSAKKSHHLEKRAAVLRATPQAAGHADDLLTSEELAVWLGVSVEWIIIGRQKNWGPKFEKLAPQIIRYKRATVLKWLAEREFANNAEYKAKQARDKKLAPGRTSAEA